MGTEIITDPDGATFTDFPTATVSTRAAWADSWVERSHLYPLRLVKSTGDTISRGSFLFQFGDILWDEDDEFQDVDRLILHRNYIKLEFTPQTGPDDPVEPVTWYGVIVQDDRTRIGSHVSKYAGNQVFHAVGLEWLFTRVVIDQAKVRTVQPFPAVDETITINRGLTFNARPDDKTQPVPGNRTAIQYSGVYLFSDQPTSLWSAYDAVQYLLDTFEWSTDIELDLDSGASAMLAWLKPTDIETDGRTLFDVLNQLISKRHGLTWTVDVADSNAPTSTEDRLRLTVHSFAPAAVTLPSGLTLPVNASLVTIDFDEAWDIAGSLEVTDSADVYDQVVCQGARRGSTFTLSVPDGTLEASWTDALEDEYDDAASTGAGYAALDISEQERRNAITRSGERLRDVYTTFRIPVSWDGTVGNGSGDIGQIYERAFPLVNADGLIDVLETEPIWLEGIRFATFVPGGPSTVPPISKPLAVCRVSEIADEWLDMSKASSLDNERVFTESVTRLRLNGYSFSSDIVVSKELPGVQILPTGESHLQAGRAWIPSSPAVSDTIPEVDWRQFAITVYAQCDTYAEGVWPETIGTPVYSDQESKLYLRFGDRARMDWLVKNTILGVDTLMQPIRAAGNVWTRNDHSWLQDVARAAWEWHSVDRLAFQLEYRQLSSLVSVGDMITTIGSDDSLRTVNSMVTAVMWDFQKGSTQIQTQFANTLDFAELV